MDVRDFTGKVTMIYGVHPHVFYYHPTGQVKRVAVIVGGASHYVMQAKSDGFDTFFTGELSESSLNLAKDLEMNLIGAGHDKTERSGVQSLARLVSRRFGIPFEFIPQANPI